LLTVPSPCFAWRTIVPRRGASARL
jgi:hypothetical protein